MSTFQHGSVALAYLDEGDGPPIVLVHGFASSKEVNWVQTKAGTQAALDGLKLAEGPREMSRIAALAEKKGSKTRAILKTLGRGAILLSVASFNLAAWMLGALMTLLGLVSSAKSAVERSTQRHLARKKERKLEQQYAMLAQSRA